MKENISDKRGEYKTKEKEDKYQNNEKSSYKPSYDRIKLIEKSTYKPSYERPEKIEKSSYTPSYERPNLDIKNEEIEKWEPKNEDELDTDLFENDWEPIDYGNDSKTTKEMLNDDRDQKVVNYKYDIVDMHKIAKKRGGQCLSEKFEGVKSNLRWECGLGHEWDATPDNVKNKNSWCPKCSYGTAERTCRQFFERLFEKDFKKGQPDWLKSPKGGQMHLDGYNKELAIAFEYQGSQHFIFTPHFHKTIERFKQDQAYDKWKKEMCEKNKVKLIQVPYTLKIEEMENYIRKQYKKLDISAPLNPKKIDYTKFNFQTEDKLKELQELAKFRGGKLLSEKYINAVTKMEWQCEKGHTWMASPNNIKNNTKGREGNKGNWCPKCAQRQKYTIEEVIEYAKAKGGECLSEEYTRAQEKLKWRCNKGHEWETSFYNVNVHNSWCPICPKEKRFLKVKEIAISKGGKCKSEEYKGAHGKLLWECKDGHKWKASPNSINNGTWCPTCAGQKKVTIEEMKILANSYGGECLSKKYSGAHGLLIWKCKNGHEWKATPNYIKSHKKWCPKCEGTKN